MSRRRRSGERGQIIVFFAFSLVVMLLALGLVIDAGYAFSQVRVTQNASDMAAMAGTRIVGESLTGEPPGAGTGANVSAAINSVLAANHAELVSASYVDRSGKLLSGVGGAIPQGAQGVVVTAKISWRPFFLGVVGMSSWTASTSATAVTSGVSEGGNVLPIGLSDTVYDGLPRCPISNLTNCAQGVSQKNIPGGFGWLAFGLQGNGGKCDWTSSLGMVADGGCQMNQPFLDSEVVPPVNSHGCCTMVGMPGSVDLINTLTGNEWADLSFYVDNQIPIWVPIWDYAGGGGANAYYHIVGFGAMILTGQDTQHGKWLTGAAIDVSAIGCQGAGNGIVPGTGYCKGPGGAFVIGATGSVRLVH